MFCYCRTDKDYTSTDASDWQIVAGDHQLSQSEDTEQITGVKKIIIHPKNFRFWKIGYKNIPDDYDIGKNVLEIARSLFLINVIF